MRERLTTEEWAEYETAEGQVMDELNMIARGFRPGMHFTSIPQATVEDLDLALKRLSQTLAKVPDPAKVKIKRGFPNASGGRSEGKQQRARDEWERYEWRHHH